MDTPICTIDPLGKDDRTRSNFIRELVQRSHESAQIPTVYLNNPPRCIVQFWDDLSRLPRDVKDCMDSWFSMRNQQRNLSESTWVCGMSVRLTSVIILQ